ncbi:hypothetical protein, partial [Novosphingobium sediminicola]|uniref:hypothetical protein n=1 Tax=Novosphingobium sediminicola TaxID=563162 RepID=UPI001C85BDD3
LNSRLNFLRCIDALRSMKTPYLGVHQTGSTSSWVPKVRFIRSTGKGPKWIALNFANGFAFRLWP